MADYLVYADGNIKRFVVALAIITEEIGVPDNVIVGPENLPPFSVIYDAGLTINQQTQLANIISRVDNSITDYGQLGQIRSDIIAAKDVLTTFYNLPSPTQAQTLAAVKKIIEVLNLFLRIFIILLDYIRFNR